MHAPHFDHVYVTATGAFYPGEAVDNDTIDEYVAPLNGASPRIKRRILAENGIQQRYYATGPKGERASTPRTWRPKRSAPASVPRE
jgi:3-oxoacyl-[acyl-carrier-protein] synthase III